MMDDLVQFYLPWTRDVEALPDTVDEYWAWLTRHQGLGGKYSWTLQTYLHLKAAGAPVRLVERFPSRGIVISHRDFLPIYLRPRPGVFLVCIKPDRRAHTWAQYYVVQNTNDRIFAGRQADSASAIGYWPQPSLLPRDAARGDRCERVSYVGRRLNLASELLAPEWGAWLAGQGLDWSIPTFETWHDYRTIDVTVSVRALRPEAVGTSPVFDPNSKPASKLVNSWLAGVPAIVGAESAYRAMRTGPLDFIEVSTLSELESALVKLKDDRALYAAMVANGRERATQYAPPQVARNWLTLLESEILPRYRSWRASNGLVRLFSGVRAIGRFALDGENLAETRIYRPSKSQARR